MDSGGFEVRVKQSEVVAAVLPVQEHWLPMSNLDLLIPPLDFGIFFFYKKSNVSPENMVAVMKKSLAQVLVPFYPFAGEIVQNCHGEPEILCNNRGVDFTYAYADVDLKSLDFSRPDISIHAKLVPLKMDGLLSVQVTEMKCGGLLVGCSLDHRVADAHSANMFLTAWAEVAQSKPIKLLPSFRRSILNPRRPPQPHESLDKLYAPLLAPPTDDDIVLSSRIYLVTANEIDRLQSQAGKSKIQSFSAFLWKTIACGGQDVKKTMRLGIVVEGRARLSNPGSSLECYFGNVLSIPYVEACVGELQSMSLNGVADMIHECIAVTSTPQHFLALIDWVEVRRPKPAVVKVYCKNENEEAAVVVSSGQRFPVHKLNFGWGAPNFASYHFPWGGQTGYVMPMPSAKGNGDWIVYMHLSIKHLHLLQACAPHVFTPLHSHYLDLA